MKSKLFALALAMGFVVSVGAAQACESKCGKAKAKTVAEKVEAKAPCGSKTAEKVVETSSPCSKPCSKSAKTVAEKTTPCGAKTAQTVADTTPPCHGKSAQTVADTTPPCHGKSAQTVSEKMTPCSKGAKTASGKPGCSSKCGMSAKTVAHKEGGCPVAAKVESVLASMPAMTYEVGDESFCCSKAAAYTAEKQSKPVHYVVGKSKFDNEGEAMARLATAMEEELKAMESVQYSVDGECSRCPMTAKSMAKKSGSKMMYRVAGWDFEEEAKAGEAAKAAHEAAEKVSMKYKVDGEAEAFGCDKMAAQSKKDGKKISYVVGEEVTCCETQARVLLAQAKVRAMIEAVAGI